MEFVEGKISERIQLRPPDQMDFKTDLAKKNDLNSKIDHYKPQARVYSDAIKTIFGLTPKEVILFFLHLMEPVSVKLLPGDP